MIIDTIIPIIPSKGIFEKKIPIRVAIITAEVEKTSFKLSLELAIRTPELICFPTYQN